MNRITGSVAALMAALSLFAAAARAPKTDMIVPDALRLHVIANSDSEEDQLVKLAVRDAILDRVNERFSASDKDEAEKQLLCMGESLQQAAEEALEAYGMDYGVQLVSGEFDFPDRTYGDSFYPAGRYDALRVILGNGAGRNWWCVMFPPLCVIESEPGEAQRDPDGTLAFRSFFAEIWREVFGR